MIIDCIADMHGFYPKLEGGDLLIVAGDLTAKDTPKEHLQFTEWLRSQPYKIKIFIGGNHDNALEKYAIVGTSGDSCYYLHDSGIEFEYSEPIRDLFNPDDKTFIYRKKFKIWGSPWTLAFKGMNPDCKAFTVDTEEELSEKWALIPDDIDIVITHSPMYGTGDAIRKNGKIKKCLGSKTLLQKLFRHPFKLHVFGHIHEDYGTFQLPDCTHVNASHVNERYEPVNPPIRVIL